MIRPGKLNGAGVLLCALLGGHTVFAKVPMSTI